jgi:hypothetical protein
VPALPGEGPSQPGKIPRRRLGPARAIRIPTIEMHQQSPERPNVFVVVANDVDERAGLSPPQVVEVARRDLPASYVAMPSQAQELRLDGGQARVRHPMLEDAPDDREEIQMAIVERRIRAGHAKPRDEQGPVEAAAVVRDEPAAARDAGRQLREQRRLVGVIWQQELDLAEQAAFPPAKADEEGQRARGGREAGRLRVEAKEGSVGGWQAREPRETRPVEREQGGGCLDHDERAEACPDQLAVNGGREPLGSNR